MVLLETRGWFDPMPCSSMAASARRLRLARGLSRQFPTGSAEPKAAGGPSSSTTKLLILLLLGVLLTTAGYDAARVCASERATHAPTISVCPRNTVCKAFVSCLLGSKKAPHFRCSAAISPCWPTALYRLPSTVRAPGI